MRPFRFCQAKDTSPMQIHRAPLVLFIMSVFALAACGSGQQEGPSSASGSAQTSSAPGSAQTGATPSAASGGQFHAEMSLVGQPSISADGKSVEVVVAVTNTGTTAFGPETGSHGVTLGAHSIDSDGAIVSQDLARGQLPQIAPGASQQATIQLPVAGVLGHRAELLPVEEGVAWFDAWGTKPLIVGPFEACSNSSVGLVCDASGKPLPVATKDH